MRVESKKSKIQKRIFDILSSHKFFYFLLGFFVFEAGWLAFSAQYPMAFDESFHLGIIQFYTHHLSPFVTSQPAESYAWGAITRDPSYLYHFLMSFPLRFISFFFGSGYVQVLLLRAINIAFFAGGIVLFRRILLKTRASRALVNTVLLFFVLTPVVPLVAAQINYDNLLFLLTGWIILLTIDFLDRLKNKDLDLRLLVGIASLGLLTSLVKYAFLPIFLAIGAYIIVQMVQFYRTDTLTFWAHLQASYWKLSGRAKGILAVLLVLSSVMFLQRYGVNMVNYGTPIPECDQVLGVDKCLHYGPWARNYKLVIGKTAAPTGNAAGFSYSWIKDLYHGLFFTINGDFIVGEPYIVPLFTGTIIGIVGFLLLLLYRRKLFKQSYIVTILLAIIIIYGLTLWAQNYSDFRHIGTRVAIQGRYLVPILLPIYLLVGLCFSYAIKKHQAAKTWLVVATTLLLLQGGGFLTYVLRSNTTSTWYFKNTPARELNQKTQMILKHVIVGA